MKSILQFCAALLLLLPYVAQSQNNYSDGLKILNPRWSSNYKVPASFDSIYLKVTPMGTYANVDITLDVSGKNSAMATSNDSLEMEYKFSLPYGSHMHAAWLWMFGSPVQAKLYEKKRAQFIYESLVSRRVDPLIIYKTDNDSYEARIFPVLHNESRKVKFSVIVPIKANSKSIELPLPLSMFRSDLSDNEPDIHIEIMNNTFWGTPSTFESGASYVTGTSTHIVLPYTQTNIFGNYSLYFNNRTADDVFITSSENSTDGYFQLFLSPKDTMPGKHFIFAIDYIQANDVSYAEIQSILKAKLKFELSEKDSFTVIYTKGGQVISEWDHWMPANSANITLGLIHLPVITNTTKLNFEVISKAIAFNNQQVNKGRILVITNGNCQFYNATTCNTKINELMSTMPAGMPYPIDVAHISTTMQYDFRVPGGNDYTSNNEYFLSILTGLTGGNYNKRLLEQINYYESSFRALGDVLGTSIDYMMPKTSFDQVNYNYAGLITNDYKLGHPVYSNQRDAHMVTGKYFGGGGDITLQRNYSANGSIFQNDFILQPVDDTTMISRKIWASSFLEDLIGNNISGIYTSEIVNESINFQVLTEYTAFLALEPDTLPKMVSNTPVSIKEQTSGSFEMMAIPNPFRDIQQIKITLSADLHQQDWECTITDISGRILAVQNGSTGNKDNLTISWNGSVLSAGMYLIKVTIGGKHTTLKVVKQD